MRTKLGVGIALLIVSVWAGALPADEGDAGGGVAALSWMAGAWRTAGESSFLEEHWSNPCGDSMMGMFRVVQGGKMQMVEMIVIEQTGDGVVMALKHFGPGLMDLDKGKVFSFRLIQSGPNEAVFEHRDVEFPGRRRIIYRRDGNSLIARLEDDRPGKETTDIAMSRIVE